jgi:hypothetical protein
MNNPNWNPMKERFEIIGGKLFGTNEGAFGLYYCNKRGYKADLVIGENMTLTEFLDEVKIAYEKYQENNFPELKKE